jgi:hypothetical protein
LVRIDEFVRQVLVGGIFTHLDSSSSDYSGVVGARLWLQTEKLPEQDPVGFDPHEGFAEVNKDGDVKNAIRVQVQVLDTVVLEKTLEEGVPVRAPQIWRTWGLHQNFSPWGMCRCFRPATY